MAGWGGFISAFGVFLLSHALPARPPIRRRLTRALGERGYLLAYSMVSVAVLAWLIRAAGQAPFILLWPRAAWQGWVVNLVMPLLCLLLAAAIGAPNPLSFGGRPQGFDPARPGVAGLTRHPLLLALALWAGAHLLANGDLAHALLFGSFAGFALLGMRIVDRRKRRQMGEANWAILAACTSNWPGAVWLNGRWRPAGPPPWSRLAVGLALWLGLLALHGPVIGVSPLPP